MKRIAAALLFFFSWGCQSLYSQSGKVNKTTFFNDTSVLHASLVTNLGKILSLRKEKTGNYTGHFKTTLSDGTAVDDAVMLEVRGNFRLNNCNIPPVRIIFDYDDASTFKKLKATKLVNSCKIGPDYDQYLLKEFVIYKMYNMLTGLSFRVRLLDIEWKDSAGKKKSFNEHAFLMEDIKDVEKRNNCVGWTNGDLYQEQTNRRQMTIVSVFQYMIGNTDWAVPKRHNIKLVISSADSTGKPYAVPYDFDWSGFVNTDYAVPDEILGIENVRQRVYRGFPRTMAELEEVFELFNIQKAPIYAMINGFSLLTASSKKEMLRYLDDFYKIINDQSQVKSVFIDNARSN